MKSSFKSGESWEVTIEVHTFDATYIKVPVIMWFRSRLQCSITTSKLRKSILDGSAIVVSDVYCFPIFQQIHVPGFHPHQIVRNGSKVFFFLHDKQKAKIATVVNWVVNWVVPSFFISSDFQQPTITSLQYLILYQISGETCRLDIHHFGMMG